MGPLHVMAAVAFLSVAVPFFLVWRAWSFALFHALATVSQPTACHCPAEVSAGGVRRVRDAIVMFVQKDRVHRMLGALHHLHKNFNGCFRKDLLLFHTGGIAPDLQTSVERSYPTARFHLLRSGSARWQLAPPGVARKPGWLAERYPVTRWHSMLVFDYLRERGFEWFMRIDDDTRIASCIDYDPFAFLEAQNYSHGYRLDQLSHPAAAEVLPELVQVHAARAGLALPPRLLARFKEGALHSGAWDRRAYHPGWMLTRLSFWGTAQVRAWLHEVDTRGVLYNHPVGDDAILTMTQLMFMRDEDVHHFRDWSHTHDSVAAVVPRTFLPSVLSSLLPEDCEWVGGVHDLRDKRRYDREIHWVFLYLLGPLGRIWHSR